MMRSICQQGFPDFDPPPVLLAAAEKAVRSGPHQYAVHLGRANFRESAGTETVPFLGIHIDPDHIAVTCGAN